MKKLLLFVLVITAAVSGCKKNTEQTPEFSDSLNEEDNAFLESISVPNPSLHDMLGYDGNPLGRKSNIQGATADLVDAMLRDAQTLSALKLDTFPGEGVNKPEHMGLVYSSGQRNITQRLNPTAGNALHLKYAVYGTDCSGFIINLFRNAGINIPNTNVADFEKSLKYALAKDNIIKLKNLGYLPSNQVKSGDLVLWIRANGNNHMGIISVPSNQETMLFQSNGTGFPENETDQANNLSSKRGVHPLSFLLATTGTGYWGTGYIILRMEDANATIKDIDGNIYNTVVIGSQVWMKENLKTAHYRNGDPIATGLSNTTWPTTTSGAFAVYENNQANNTLYGKLYNWYAAVDSRKICPTGWHMPSDEEWKVLINYLGGLTVAGGKMKEAGLTYWKNPNTGASNSSGFSGRPAGYRKDGFGAYYQLGEAGYWWSSSHATLDGAGTCMLYYSLTNCDPGSANEKNGFSCRCIKD